MDMVPALHHSLPKLDPDDSTTEIKIIKVNTVGNSSIYSLEASLKSRSARSASTARGVSQLKLERPIFIFIYESTYYLVSAMMSFTV